MSQQKAIDLINRMAADLGLFPARTRTSLIWWRVPKGWDGTRYAFGYTPWKTRDDETGERGFFAVKYRILKNGSMKLVKKVRFGRRKIAKARSVLWYRKYYETEKTAN